jgi:hypothetical protein
MTGPTRNGFQSNRITIRIEIRNGRLILHSGGSTYEITDSGIYIIPKWYKETFGMWNGQIGQYVVVTSSGEVLHVSDTAIPTEMNVRIKYAGVSARRFVGLLNKILARYYRGGVMKLPLYDREVKRVAIALARMASLQPISDIV